jgi:hypothetical protein
MVASATVAAVCMFAMYTTRRRTASPPGATAPYTSTPAVASAPLATAPAPAEIGPS